MNELPALDQQCLLLPNDFHGATDLGAVHAVGPNQDGSTIDATQINFRLTVTEDVNVRRSVIVREDDDTQAAGTKHGDHGTE
jgi:hypothetical protein